MQSADEAALRALVEKFYTAHQKKDLDGFMALWSEKSPDYASRKQTMQRLFATTESTFTNLTILRVKVEGDAAMLKASLRAALDHESVNTQTQQKRKERMMRTFAFVKEDGVWKVWRYAPAEDDLATALMSAKGEEDRKALLTAEKELVTPQLVQALRRQGSSLHKQGDSLHALAVYRLAQDIAEQIGDKAEVAKTLNSMGIVYDLQHNYAQALECYQKSLTLHESLGDKAGVADALNNIAIVYEERGDYAQAVEFYQKSLALEETLGRKAKIAATLYNIGGVYREQGNYSMALESFQKSLQMKESLGDKRGIADALNGIGTVYDAQSNYTKALEFFQKSLQMAEASGDQMGVAVVFNNIGGVYKDQGNFDRALEFYQKSLTLHESLGDKVGTADVLHNMGLVYDWQGNYTQALESFQKALKQFEAVGEKVKIAIALHSIGGVYRDQGNYARAVEFYQKSLILEETSGRKAGVAFTLHGIGTVYDLQGNHDLALEFYQKALKQFEALGNQAEVASVLNNIGGIHKDQGNSALALEFYQKSLMMDEMLGRKAGIAASLNNIGIIYKEQDNYERALEFYQKSLTLNEALGNKAGVALSLNNMGAVNYLQGNYSQAMECFQKGLAITQAIGDHDLTFIGYKGIGATYREQGQKEQAIAAYQKAISTAEVLRGQVAGREQEQQQFFESKVGACYAIVELLIDQNKISEALTYAERAKARVLLDVLHSGRVNVAKAMTADEQEKERKLNNELISLNTQIFRESQRQQPDAIRLSDLKTQLHQVRLDYEAFQISLYAAHPQLKAQRGEAKPLTLEEAGALLPDAKTALLEFVVMEEKTYLFVITMRDEGLGMQDKSAGSRSSSSRISHPSSLILKVYILNIKQKDLAERVTRFRTRLANKDGRFAVLARELHDLLFKPAQAQLQGKTTFCLVPDGALWELPFQALQSQENRYLLEDAAVFYAPSLTVLREMQRVRMGVWEYGSVGDKNTPTPPHSHTPTPTLLALGNPSLNKQTVERVQLAQRGATLSPLPEAEREVKMLAQLYGAGRSKAYVGAEAREERVKAEAGQYRVLHFATHGLLDDSSPMYSQILLSQSSSPSDQLTTNHSPEDGLLEAWELMNLNLQAELVVLSACETARGRVGAGEGVIGLTWALFVAGCPTTVVSQWKVMDKSTSQLMVEFHRQLKSQIPNPKSQIPNPKSQIAKAEALRQAALKLLRSKDYNHPFYWAGFVVVGDGR